jgi:hypothetical protein
LTADVAGSVGNTITYETAALTNNATLSVKVDGTAITVTLATNATGVITSTNSDVAAALNAFAPSAGLVDAVVAGIGTTPATVTTPAVSLDGGTDVEAEQSIVTLSGTPAVGDVITVTVGGDTSPTTYTVVETDIGVNDAASLAAIAIKVRDAINADVEASAVVTAAASGAAITLTADVAGIVGAFDLASSVERATVVGIIVQITEGNPMTIRQTVPTVTKLANQTVLTGANDVALEFTVTADSAGDVELRTITVSFAESATADVTEARLYVGATRIATDAVIGDTTNVAVFDITTAVERNIAAGTSQTFTVRADSTVTGNGQTVVASIADTAAHFMWRDGAVTTDINGALVEALPVTGDTLIQP